MRVGSRRWPILGAVIALGAFACAGGPADPSDDGSRFVLALKNSTLLPYVFSEVDTGAAFTVQALDEVQIVRTSLEGRVYAFTGHPQGKPGEVSGPVECVYHAERERPSSVARRVEWNGNVLQCSLW